MAVLNPYNYKKPIGAMSVNKRPKISIVKEPKKTQQDIYLEQKVMSAKPEELTLMLYEGLVKFIKLAKMFLEENNIKKTHEMSMRAQAIVTELQATLDMQYDVSANLDSLYDFVNDRLVTGNMQKQVKPYDEALEIAEELHDTWKEAVASLK